MHWKRSCVLLKKIWNHEPRKKINVHLLEYWACCRASPAQPEVEKEKTARGQSCKLQAPSFKRHETDTIMN